MQSGDKVRLIANPAKIGILGNETDGPEYRQRVLVTFLDGDEDFILRTALEKINKENLGPYTCLKAGRFGRVDDLRGSITYYRLSGKLANLIYSLNTTNTQFFAYQFKPVLQFLESPCNGILIADEVGLGKTIEAGLIWTELRARFDARRLLVIAPAMLREKWKDELSNRFGVNAEIVDARVLLERLEAVRERPQTSFALIASIQGIRPPRGFNDKDKNYSSLNAAGKLARFLEDVDVEDPLLDMVIVDEAHYLRNRETQTNRLARLIRPVTQNLVMLSATPIQLRSTDLFNLLNLIDEDAFPYEFSFEHSLMVNAPVVRLRDLILARVITQEEFLQHIDIAIKILGSRQNLQLKYLRENPPNESVLADTKGRSELADQLDKINPLTKVITRTLKRDVQEMRVVRSPSAIRAEMYECEELFYQQVTEKIRQFCEKTEMSTGFILTIPQRQMSSSMAAACRGWQNKMGEWDEQVIAETVFESVGLDEDQKTAPNVQANMGTLLEEPVQISLSVGSFQKLRQYDSKFTKLLESLKQYWRDNPSKKVVLFSFYRQTLKYLSERLAEVCIDSVIVQGGMDKHAAIKHFTDVQGPNILLASEVASEGVDLQFSSLVINYDLPWNPMRIEQRIGRIDRIGQEAGKILIWNFMYANTVDERVYDRLLERLDIFTQALGSMEAILGDQIADLTIDLLTHQLTPEQEEDRINRASLAIENNNRQQEVLEHEASQLIAHSDFIQNKVKAAKELGRYIRGEDLLIYVRDFLTEKFSGSRLFVSEKNHLEYVLEFSIEARVAFSDFIAEYRLAGRTQILSSRPLKLLFENKVGNTPPQTEKVTQDHPLIRFVTESLRRDSGEGVAKYPVSAIKLPSNMIENVILGVYVFAIYRWTVSGARDIERLEYRAKLMGTDSMLDSEKAENLVNIAAIDGTDWLGAANELDNKQIADVFEDCVHYLEQQFKDYRDNQERANKDRVHSMIEALQKHLEKQRANIIDRIKHYRNEGTDKQRRLIPAEEGKLNKLTKRLNDRMSELRLKEQPTATQSFVSGGVIKLY